MVKSDGGQDELPQMKKIQVKDSRGPVFTPNFGDIVIFRPKESIICHNLEESQNYSSLT